MNLLIVILNYRTPQVTVDCLASLNDKQEEIPGGFRAVVVENGSGDGSGRRIHEAVRQNNWADWAELLESSENRGFAGGNNAALELLATKYRGVRYVLLLNNDTIVHAGALAHCFELMERESDIGVMSCLLLNSDGSPQNVTRDFPSPLKQAVCTFGLPWHLPGYFAWADIYTVPDALLKQKRDVDWLGGAFNFIRVTALKDVGGGLDDSFFFYGEDIEFCFRFHKHGWRVHYDPAAAITHIGGASSDPRRIGEKLKNAYVWRARYQVQRKCYGVTAAWFIRACDLLALALRKATMFLKGRNRSEPEQYRHVSDALAILLKPLGGGPKLAPKSPVRISSASDTG